MRNNRSRCIASVGTRINGLLTLTSSCLNEPSASLRITLPAKVRSLSNHVCHNPPPYVCTFTIWCPDLKEADLGFSLRHGLSVWAAIMLNPFPNLYLHPKNNFTSNIHLQLGSWKSGIRIFFLWNFWHLCIYHLSVWCHGYQGEILNIFKNWKECREVKRQKHFWEGTGVCTLLTAVYTGIFHSIDYWLPLQLV